VPTRRRQLPWPSSEALDPFAATVGTAGVPAVQGLFIARRVLHKRDHPGGHEPGGSYGCPRARDLGDLDRSPNVGDLDPPAGSAGLDLEPLDPRSHVDDDFHTVTLHRYQGICASGPDSARPRVGQDRAVPVEPWGWPDSDEELIELQERLSTAAASALAADPWLKPGKRPTLGGCFVAYDRSGTGPGRPGDRAWAAAVTWRGDDAAERGARRTDHHLKGMPMTPGCPRQADDVLGQSVVAARASASYVPGLLARREGPILAAALAALEPRPELLLVDASGLDHPRGAGLAVHLGAVVGLPTVGVTRRPLVAAGDQPELRRGAVAPLQLGGRCVAFWVCTRTGAHPLVAHCGWRTSPETAVRVVLDASTPAARTPVPLQEARRVAREARSLARAG